MKSSGVLYPNLTESGTLPAGITFTSLSAMGVPSGTPAAGTAGVYSLTLIESNGVDPVVSQSLTL